jgi:YidC/Oxa1 family membrane protein insertase
MFDLLFEGFSSLIAFFYSVVPSYGIAICLLTVAVRLLLFPLTAKQAKSMYAMQKVQPEMKRLQQKYKNDRQKLNEEMMKFYKENNINPLAGCLPLFLQLPLFIVLYQVISGLTHTVIVGAIAVGGVGVGPALEDGRLGFGEGAQIDSGRVNDAGVLESGSVKNVPVLVDGEEIGLIKSAKIENGTVTTAAVYDDAADDVKIGEITNMRVELQEGGGVRGDPKYIAEDTELYKALEQDDGVMESFGIDLARSASDRHDGFGETLPYFVLVALVVATGYYQQRQMTARNPQAAANPQAQMMGRIFPAVFGVISLSIAAGVVVYFVVSNLWQIGQQTIIFRSLPRDTEAAAGVIETKSKVRDDDGAARERPVSDGSDPTGRTTPRGQQRSQRKRRK